MSPRDQGRLPALLASPGGQDLGLPNPGSSLGWDSPFRRDLAEPRKIGIPQERQEAGAPGGGEEEGT